MNLRFRLNLVVTLVLLVILMIGAWVTVNNARESVRAEVDSTMDLALHMLDAELAHVNRSGYIRAIDQNGIFDLARFSGVRHLRIEFFNTDGVLVETNRQNNVFDEQPPPQWFIDRMLSGLNEVGANELSVSINDEVIGKLVISPEPASEINEAWQETRNMLMLIALFFITVNIVVYIAVAISLKPIDEVINALTDIEDRSTGSSPADLWLTGNGQHQPKIQWYGSDHAIQYSQQSSADSADHPSAGSRA